MPDSAFSAASRPPELLAPAGNLETALAAYDAGADAVYGGLGRFNARERAENFTFDGLGRLIEAAHRRGKKFYLTLNTLVKESELGAVAEYLAELTTLAPDALIVQDPGIVHLARTAFPSLALHASTQMGIHNRAGLAMAARLGFSRVILERQVTMAELRQMAADSPVEIEVFLHGSLCCSLSGRCLLSSAQGGWSGNRGKCKQPCRRFYETAGAAGFLLSPRDLYGVPLLPELRRLGVASLKIEGRLRTPDYVWKTVRAYRLLLDAPIDPPPEVLAEAEKWLASTATRRPSPGFFRGTARQAVIDPERFGAYGNVVAEVLDRSRRGLRVRSCARLHLGDRLRLVPPDGGDGASFSLIRMEGRGREYLKLPPGGECFIPGDFAAAPGWRLCKIGENGFDFSRRAAALPAPRRPVSLTIRASAGAWSAEVAGIAGAVWRETTDFAPAEKRPVTAETIERAFAEGAPEPWRTERVEVRVEGAFFVPASRLKELRRRFWEAALPRLDPDTAKRAAAAALSDFYRRWRAAEGASEIDDPRAGALTIPAFVPESEVARWREKIRRRWERGERRFVATGLHALELLRELPGCEIIAAFPLPASNSEAVRLLAECGCTAAEMEPEMEAAAERDLLAKSPLPLYRGGDPPLLVTRLDLAPGAWRDARGAAFRVEADPTEKTAKLYTAEPGTRMRFQEGEWK